MVAKRSLYTLLTLLLVVLTINPSSARVPVSQVIAATGAGPAPTTPAQALPQQELTAHLGRDDLVLRAAGVEVLLPVENLPAGATVTGVELKVRVGAANVADVQAMVAAPGQAASTLVLLSRPAAQGGGKAGVDSKSTIGASELSHAFDGVAAEGTWSVRLETSDPVLDGQKAALSILIHYRAALRLPELLAGDAGAQPAFAQLPRTAQPSVVGAPEPKAGASGSVDSSVTAAQTIMSENFEGIFPASGWTLYDLTNDGSQRLWDDDDYKPYGGSWSAWPANGGSQGLDPQFYYYPSNMNSWMIYGPFDLSNATDAQTVFYLWREIETRYDYFFFGASGDGSNFSGYFYDGNVGWSQQSIGLSSWVGDSSVWVGWQFYSDSSIVDDGPFVDNITLSKTTASCGPYTNAQNRVIPDDGSWLDLPLNDRSAPRAGVLSDIFLKYTTDHPVPEQLELELLHVASGTRQTLWNQGQPLPGTTLGVAAGLSAFRGQAAQTEWRLRVRDTIPGEQGSLTAASLRANYAPAESVVEVRGGSYGQASALSLPAGLAPAQAADGDPAKPAVEPALSPDAWQTITTEGFEGAFPGSGWTLYDLSDDGCEFLWDDDNGRAFSGSWAAWPANGGANGLDPDSSRYPPNLNSWMIYGPFDLSDASDAETVFELWRQTESNFDKAFFGVSSNGVDYNGIFWDGTSDWTEMRVGYADYVGDSTVWVAWVFQSDASINLQGPWVDNINVRKFVGQQSQPDITVTPTSLAASLQAGQSVTQTLVIGNIGTGDLNVSLRTLPPAATAGRITFPDDKLDPALDLGLLEESNRRPDVLVYLGEQASLDRASTISDWKSRGEFVYNALWKTAQHAQADLVQFLNSRSQAGELRSMQPFYIVNAVLVRDAAPDLIADLEARADVAYIEALGSYAIPDPEPGLEVANTIDGIEWGISKIRAPEIWNEFNNRGEGTVVANIDTGVLRSHPALSGKYRGVASGSNDYNWFDATGDFPASPGDDDGHGTHTMGTMVGNDGDYQIGVAPGARWIAARACTSENCPGNALLAAAQWVLAPFPIGGTPANGDPSKRPHVVNNSWGGPGGALWYQAAVNAWRAADIFPAFSAGNSGGDGAGSVGSPGDYPQSFAVGATDRNDVIADFSSRGPSRLTSETKPDISAPGVGVRSSVDNGGYGTYNGTSMASPHVAGCVALVRKAEPSLSIEAIEALLDETAVDLGASGPDTSYGHGRLDCFAALSSAGTGITWLTLGRSTATVAPGASQAISVRFDAGDLPAGTVNAVIRISSNDSDEATVNIPVALTVQQGALISLPSNIPASLNRRVDVPINLFPNGTSLASAIFSIDYDQNCLAFDPTDGNNDGLPDAVSFNLPAAFNRSVSFNSSDSGGELDFFIGDVSPPLSVLPGASIATVSFNVTCRANQGQPRLVPIAFSTNPPASFGNTSGQTIAAMITNGSILIQPDQPGDCNSDQAVDAGDITALILEIFDGDGENPADTPGGSFPGSSVGCNANGDGAVNAADITYVILLVFNRSSGVAPGTRPADGDQIGGPQLSMPSSAIAPPNGVVNLPISFDGGDEQVSSVLFSIDYDETLLGFNPDDANNDNIPDAISFSQLSGFSVSAAFNASDTAGEIDIIIADFSPPLTGLPDGTLLTIALTTTNQASPKEAPVRFAQPSFGNPQGQALAGSADDGSVLITLATATPTLPPSPTATATTTAGVKPPATVTPTSTSNSGTDPTLTPTERPKETTATVTATVTATPTRDDQKSPELDQLLLPLIMR